MGSKDSKTVPSRVLPAGDKDVEPATNGREAKVKANLRPECPVRRDPHDPGEIVHTKKGKTVHEVIYRYKNGKDETVKSTHPHTAEPDAFKNSIATPFNDSDTATPVVRLSYDGKVISVVFAHDET